MSQKLENPQEDINRIEQTLGWYLKPGEKRDLLQRWLEKVERLHYMGVYKEPVNTICTHVRHRLKELGYDHSIQYLMEVAAYKYKNPSKINSNFLDEQTVVGEPTEDSSITPYKCKQTNKQYIHRLERTIDNLKLVKKHLETDTIFVPKLDQHELGEYFVRWDHACEQIEEILDGREKVPPSTQHLLFYALSTSTQNFTFSEYVRYIRKLSDLTAKQAGKILRGHVTKIQALYEPTDTAQACSVGFFGKSCDECGSYRQDKLWRDNAPKPELFCYACKAWNPVKTESLLVKIPSLPQEE